MRELTFKGYLEQQLCEMSGYKSKSLYKFAKSSADNARLKNVLCLYLNNTEKCVVSVFEQLRK